MWEKIVKGAAAAAGVVAGFWGGLPVLLQTMAVFMAVDYLTGLICALKGVSGKSENGALSSQGGL